MRVIDIKPVRRKTQALVLPPAIFIFKLFGNRRILMEKRPLHPSAEQLREIIFGRFLLRPLGVDYQNSLSIISNGLYQILYEFPPSVIDEFAKPLLTTPEEEIETQGGVFGWLQNSIRTSLKLKFGEKFDDLIWKAAKAQARGAPPNGYHPVVYKIAANLPDRQKQLAQTSFEEEQQSCQESTSIRSSNL